jgi:hypothetical protein
MGILDKLKRKAETTLSETRLEDELIYEKILEEMESGFTQKGLYAKAKANSKGDEKEANSLYLKYRLQSLKDSLKEKNSVEYFRDSLLNLNQQNTDEDESFYLMVTDEINEGNVNQALWAKCDAISMGDEAKTKYGELLEKIKESYILLLQVSSPTRTLRMTNFFLKKFSQNKAATSSVSLTRILHPHPDKIQTVKNNLVKSYLDKESMVPRELLPKVYCLNGLFYIAESKYIVKKNTFFTESLLLFKKRYFNTIIMSRPPNIFFIIPNNIKSKLL